MLAGTPPYTGSVQEVLLGHASPEPAPALDAAALRAPRSLCALVASLLAKDPLQRPRSAEDVAAALQSHAARAAA